MFEVLLVNVDTLVLPALLVYQAAWLTTSTLASRMTTLAMTMTTTVKDLVVSTTN